MKQYKYSPGDKIDYTKSIPGIIGDILLGEVVAYDPSNIEPDKRLAFYSKGMMYLRKHHPNDPLIKISYCDPVRVTPLNKHQAIENGKRIFVLPFDKDKIWLITNLGDIPAYPCHRPGMQIELEATGQKGIIDCITPCDEGFIYCVAISPTLTLSLLANYSLDNGLFIGFTLLRDY